MYHTGTVGLVLVLVLVFSVLDFGKIFVDKFLNFEIWREHLYDTRKLTNLARPESGNGT